MQHPFMIKNKTKAKTTLSKLEREGKVPQLEKDCLKKPLQLSSNMIVKNCTPADTRNKQSIFLDLSSPATYRTLQLVLRL